MKQVLILILLFNLQHAFAQKAPRCNCSSPNLFKTAEHRLKQIWTEGKNELYIPTYAWHNRFTYEEQRINNFNENSWGGGLGKSFYDEKGNWHGLYGFAFLDSHKNVEPVLGYAYLKILNLNENTRLGGGYAILVTARPDIFNNIPFPGVLPWVSFNYRRASLAATYIPGSKGAGNVLFLVSKWVL